MYNYTRDPTENNEPVITVLLEHKPNIDARDHGGLTPLLLAASRRNSPAIRLLIDAGADTIATDNNGLSALHLAAAGDNSSCQIDYHPSCNHCNDLEETVRLLTEYGHVDLERPDKDGMTPLMFAADRDDENKCAG